MHPTPLTLLELLCFLLLHVLILLRLLPVWVSIWKKGKENRLQTHLFLLGKALGAAALVLSGELSFWFVGVSSSTHDGGSH